MSNLEYNDAWLVTLSNIPTIDMGEYIGPFSGNGKVGVYGSMTDIGAQKTVLSANLTFNQIGKYRNNMIDGFNMHGLKFINNTSSNITYELQHQTLDMSKGSIETRFTVMSNNIETVDVTHTMIPLRQYPYCVLQSVEFSMLAPNVETLDVYHEIMGDARFISDVDFNNNVIYNERIYADKGLYILNGVGNINRVGHNEKQARIAGAACYLFENNEEGGGGSSVKNLGFNVYNNLSGCYQKHRFSNMYGEGEPLTMRFHVLSAQMTTMDFPDPMEEIKRILLNIAFKNENVTTLISQIMSDNTTGWDKLWASDIQLEPKANISEEEAKDVTRIRQYIRSSLYNIYCCVRDGVNTDINPLNLSYLDANGNILFDGDLWIVPSLLFLKPAMAKLILELRYRNLEQATQLAASFGYKGSKFPYENDVLGYQSMYWDVISPLHIFNNALIAINTWNYYRITLDKEWLANKGYSMMRNIADFLSSVVTIDENGEYNITNVAGMSERISSNHAFTIYAAKLALKYTIEASYELSFIAKAAWTDSYLNLDISTLSGNNCAVIMYDDAYAGEDVDVLDNLLILTPYFSSLFFNPNLPCRDSNAINQNLTYFADRVTTGYENDALNNLIFASLKASASQTNSAYLTQFYETLVETLDENTTELWGYFSRTADKTKDGNNVSLSAFFVMMFMTCLGGLKIQGGVAASKFYYEEFGIRGTYYANMPNTWKNIKFKGVGPNQELFNVINTVAYTP